MTKIDLLERKVRDLYEAKTPGRAAEWADWLYEHHVFVVANFAGELATAKGASVDVAKAAAMLHDIADVRLKRRDPKHEQESLNIARTLMKESGFSQEDIAIAVDDAIKWHSCHDDDRPQTLEGQILATADSLAHLKTDFYIHSAWAFGREKTLEETKAWTRKKLPRDLNVKIVFDDVRENARPDYNLLMELFSR